MDSTGREPEKSEDQEATEISEVAVEPAMTSNPVEPEAGVSQVAEATELPASDEMVGEVEAGSTTNEVEETLVPVRPRNAPRYGAFIGVGVLVGIILAVVLYFALPSDGSANTLTGLIYLMLLVSPLTALLGGLVAVLFERRSLRK